MEKFKVIINPTAKKDMAWHKKADNQAVNKKIIRILEELQVHPFTGTGKPGLYIFLCFFNLL